MCWQNLSIGKAVQGSSDPLNMFHKSSNSVGQNMFDPLDLKGNMTPKTPEAPAKTVLSNQEGESLSSTLEKKRKLAQGTVLATDGAGSSNVLASGSTTKA